MTTEQKAIELLKTRIDTMEVQINDGLVDYSYEDLTDFVECAEFLSVVKGVKYDTRKAQKLINWIQSGKKILTDGPNVVHTEGEGKRRV